MNLLTQSRTREVNNSFYGLVSHLGKIELIFNIIQSLFINFMH
jgi:hypothetical protein